MRVQRGVRFVAALGTLLIGPRTTLAAQVADRETHSLLLLDQLEVRDMRGQLMAAWDAIGWYGGDVNRLWFKSNGGRAARGQGTDAEFELLYGRLIAPFWDALVGAKLEMRSDARSRRTRMNAVVALEGIAPWWFELEPSLFVSDRGDVSAEVAATYELYVTQRLVAQPRLDVRAALQEVPSFGVGAGLNSTELGLRLRYEIRRELAPYFGVTWTSSLAGTATLARAAGEPVSTTALMGGIRLWF